MLLSTVSRHHHTLETAHRAGEGEGGEGFGEVVKSLVSLNEFHDIGIGGCCTEDSISSEGDGGILDVNVGDSDLVSCLQIAPLNILEGGSSCGCGCSWDVGCWCSAGC